MIKDRTDVIVTEDGGILHLVLDLEKHLGDKIQIKSKDWQGIIKVYFFSNTLGNK